MGPAHRRKWPLLTPPPTDVVVELTQTNNFHIEKTLNAFGSEKEIISLKNAGHPFKLDPIELEVAKHVLQETKSLRFDEFIKLVYSTYPVVTQPKGSYLNLVQLAKDYKSKSVLFA